MNLKEQLETIKSDYKTVLEAGNKFADLLDEFYDKYESVADELADYAEKDDDLIDLQKQADDLKKRLDL